eukprot:2795692-Prymnesium_polylepis.1
MRLHRRARKPVNNHAERIGLRALDEGRQQLSQHVFVANQLAGLLFGRQLGRGEQAGDLDGFERQLPQFHYVRRERGLAGSRRAREPHDVLGEHHLAPAKLRLNLGERAAEDDLRRLKRGLRGRRSNARLVGFAVPGLVIGAAVEWGQIAA